MNSHLVEYIGYHRALNSRDLPPSLKALCGFDEPKHLLYPSRNKDGFFLDNEVACNPTCEACILLHFANPENTEYLED